VRVKIIIEQVLIFIHLKKIFESNAQPTDFVVAPSEIDDNPPVG